MSIKRGLSLGAFTVVALLVAGASYWAIHENSQSGPPPSNVAEAPRPPVQSPTAPENSPQVKETPTVESPAAPSRVPQRPRQRRARRLRQASSRSRLCRPPHPRFQQHQDSRAKRHRTTRHRQQLQPCPVKRRCRQQTADRSRKHYTVEVTTMDPWTEFSVQRRARPSATFRIAWEKETLVI